MNNVIYVEKVQEAEARLASICAGLMREGIAFDVRDEANRYVIRITGY